MSLADLTVRTLPNQSLRAHIPFTLLPGQSLTEVEVRLASAELYAERELPRAPLLEKLVISLQDMGRGRGRVQFFSEKPWRGEAMTLLLLVSWDEGSMERRYEVAAATDPEGAPPRYVTVAKDERLDEIAMRLSKGSNRSYLHMMYALFQANPDAFYRGNMNNLKSGQTLRVPTRAELYALSDREVFGGIRSQYDEWTGKHEAEGKLGTLAGEALAGMSEEQVEQLDLNSDSEQLQQRLQQVTNENASIDKENEELRQRLQQLEQRMESVTGQVLDYAAEEPSLGSVPPVLPQKPSEMMAEAPSMPQQVEAPPSEPDEPDEADKREGGPDNEVSEDSEKENGEKNKEKGGLSGSGMLLAIFLVLLAVYFIRATERRRGQR